MRTPLSLLLCLAALAVAAPGARAEPPAPLRVLTYNIHHGRGSDGRIDLKRIAAVIQRCKPHLVALQEVDRLTKRSGGVDQAARLGELTDMGQAFGKAIDYSGGEYGEAILSRFDLLEVENHPLPADEGFEKRAALAVRVAVPRIGELWFVGTHLDHTRQPDQRVAQAKRLQALFADRKLPVLLAGDLNGEPTAAVMQPFADAWTISAPLPAEKTWPADAPHKKLDYLLTRKADRWKVKRVEVVDERIASDHRPLLVELEWSDADE